MIARPKGSKGKCDVLFSKIIRSRGYCLNCGSNRNLQCAHIISRTYSGTRCDPRNAWCLCATCHFRFTAWPREHSQFITKTIGSEIYDEIKLKAESINKINWDDELIKLKALASELGVA